MNQQEVQFRTGRNYLASTHGIYCHIHIVIALFLAIAAAAMILYGLGWFSDMKMLKAAHLGASWTSS